LDVVDPGVDDGQQLVGRLDALGDDARAEVAAQANDARDEARPPGIFVEVDDQAPVELDDLGLEIRDVAQVGVDATSLPVKDKDSPTGLTIGSLWGYVGDESAVVFLYTRSGHKVGQVESEIGPETFLAARTGFVVADAAAVFDASFQREDLIEVGCNMHGRRYFVKALDAGDKRAAHPIAAFRALYDVEADARALDDDARLALRQSRSRPIYDELVRWCRTYEPTEPPSSLLGKAIGYLLNHQLALTRFLDDGRLPIDNGIIERLHRRPAVGRRNYLFAGSHEGAKRAAIAYSLCATCNLLEIDPVAYLADVLPALARGVAIAEIRALTPASWKDRKQA
jgi:transposase